MSLCSANLITISLVWSMGDWDLIIWSSNQLQNLNLNLNQTETHMILTRESIWTVLVKYSVSEFETVVKCFMYLLICQSKVKWTLKSGGVFCNTNSSYDPSDQLIEHCDCHTSINVNSLHNRFKKTSWSKGWVAAIYMITSIYI